MSLQLLRFSQGAANNEEKPGAIWWMKLLWRLHAPDIIVADESFDDDNYCGCRIHYLKITCVVSIDHN